MFKVFLELILHHQYIKTVDFNIVLPFFLAITSFCIAQSDAQLQAATQFASDTATMGRLVEANLNTDIKALKGGSSLFAASDDVDFTRGVPPPLQFFFYTVPPRPPLCIYMVGRRVPPMCSGAGMRPSCSCMRRW